MKKLVIVGLTAAALALTGCGGNANADDPNHYNNTYCEGNVYTAVDEDDYTCSRNGVVYFEGDHEDDSHKKKKSSHGAPGPAGISGSWTKPKPTSGYKAQAPAYKAPAYKAPSSSSKSFSFKKK